MSGFGKGLTGAPTAALIGLLRAVHKKYLPFPITRAALIEAGYGNVEYALSSLCGLDERGARAVLVAVIAERRAAEKWRAS